MKKTMLLIIILLSINSSMLYAWNIPTIKISLGTPSIDVTDDAIRSAQMNAKMLTIFTSLVIGCLCGGMLTVGIIMKSANKRCHICPFKSQCLMGNESDKCKLHKLI